MFPQRTLLVDGSEGRMMLEFCKKFNCTLLIVEGLRLTWLPGDFLIVLTSAEDGHEWGEVYDNYTGNGLHGRVMDKVAEVAVGGLYIW